MHQLPSRISMRPFGELADLDLDFADRDRPGLVTALLTQCASGTDIGFWWAQPVSRRSAALLRLVAATDGVHSLPFSARCPACNEVFEFELQLAPLLGTAEAEGPIQVSLGPDSQVTLRRPTGEDLRNWRQARPGTPDVARRLMLDSLLLAGQVRPEDEAQLSAAIAEADPLVALAVGCNCPACGADSEVPIDLDDAALARLNARQRALLRDVHDLASRYGWSEAQVLALTPARRAQYLALIEASR
ncbi:hypothetical protein D6Z43_27210 [Pseudomonas sp. DY-1]|uniref:hypothetical protein n=1 Tax=Pseudomonas sp. DY-1 TaxID=1755504 RepID=UPI000EA94D5D|nr:hypothetical protein [Pseudomonas sp. DY-1]AYF90646.1 hypothetical protein D6Z43_27210 [Pseudomonas sp. DY-1]